MESYFFNDFLFIRLLNNWLDVFWKVRAFLFYLRQKFIVILYVRIFKDKNFLIFNFAFIQMFLRNLRKNLFVLFSRFLCWILNFLTWQKLNIIFIIKFLVQFFQFSLFLDKMLKLLLKFLLLLETKLISIFILFSNLTLLKT